MPSRDQHDAKSTADKSASAAKPASAAEKERVADRKAELKDQKGLDPAAAEADVHGTGVDLTDTVLEGAVPAPAQVIEPPSSPKDSTPRILGIFKPGDGRRYHPGQEAALQRDGLSGDMIARGRREGTLAGAWNPVLDDPNYDPSQPDGFQGAGGRLTTADLAKDPQAGNPTVKDKAIAAHADRGADADSFARATGTDVDAKDAEDPADDEPTKTRKAASRSSKAAKSAAKKR